MRLLQTMWAAVRAIGYAVTDAGLEARGPLARDTGPMVQSHLRLLKKLAPWRHWVRGEAVTRVRLIAGCVRLDCFLALSLLRSSGTFASVARGR